MVRGKTLSLHEQANLSLCSNCGKYFTSLLRHLNHRESKCKDWSISLPHPTRFPSPQAEFDTTNDIPPPPTASDSEPISNFIPTHPGPFRTVFPNGGKVYGQGKSFLDRFNDDKHALLRVHNLYYPFADQEEWELGAFLLRSEMSMQKVDDFLKLKLVRD
jgi:hypothetical protein